MMIAEWDKASVKFRLSFGFRLANALLTFTFFQPDEYFQAWEPAYADIHRVGFRAWEWQAGIRTSLMPRAFALIIRAAEFLHVDHLLLAKLIMALLAAVADVATSNLPKRVLPPRLATLRVQRITWLVSLASFFNWQCSTRPFSNTVEMVLVVCALNWWQTCDYTRLLAAQVLAHIAIALRPSDGFFWLLIGVHTLYTAPNWSARLRLALFSAVVAVFAQGAILLLDQNYYAELGTGATLPIVEFMRHNFGSRVSEIYGIMPWHWYLSQGVPFIVLGYLPFLVCGWPQLPVSWKWILSINLMAFSGVAHKEFRFIYFLLPVLHVVVALGMQQLHRHRWLVRGALVVNVAVGSYFSLFHQKGVYDVVQYIRYRPRIERVSFLMPCHSTPWRAHFERLDPNFSPQFLTCDPPWDRSSEGYIDEADQFYLDPPSFLADHPEKLAPYVAVFEPLLPMMKDMGYSEVCSFYNGLYNEDSRRRGRVYLLKSWQ